MGWIYTINIDENQNTIIIVETDVISTNDNKTSTYYSVIQCPCSIQNYNFMETSLSLDHDGFIVGRIPYLSSSSTLSTKSTIDNSNSYKLNSNSSIQCKFCEHELFPLNNITQIKDLPSGIFDSVSFYSFYLFDLFDFI